LSKFEELALDPRILRGLDAVGYVEPFPIQEKAIGPLMRGIDVVAQAKSGTGKTAAYALPLLQRISVQSRSVQGLILAPTRELAAQIADEFKRLGQFTGAKVTAIYGGHSINTQFEALSHGVHVVVGTPGRIIDHLHRKTLHLDSARYVVLDEADTMLDMGFIEDVELILKHCPKERQLSLFSATMPEPIIQLSNNYMNHPQTILVDSEPSVGTLDQYYTIVEDAEKFAVLTEILNKQRPDSTIIFCATRNGTSRLSRELERRFERVVHLHGGLSQHQRDHSMGLFRSGHAGTLVATDVAGRGIDIPQVDCVINYNVPKHPLLYFHRVGRTARAGGSGRSYTLVSRRELRDFGRIQGLTKVTIKPLKPQDERVNFTAFQQHDRVRREGPQRTTSRRRRFQANFRKRRWSH